SSRLIRIVERLTVFILIRLYLSHKALSPLNIPFFRVTFPNFWIPGIFTVEYTLLLPPRYSITWVSDDKPVTSWKIYSASSHLTWNENLTKGHVAADCADPSS